MEDRRPFVPKNIKDARSGTRPSVAPLLAMIDTEEAAFSFIAAELQAMAKAGVDLDEKSIDIATQVGRSKYDEMASRCRTAPSKAEVVYYIRRSELVKIGTTTDPVKRMKSLMPDEILAFEPGGKELEQQRHRQFNPERVARKSEYFRLSPRLQQHIDKTRAAYGEVPEDWPTTATLGRQYRRGREVIQLPEPVSGELLTGAEAARRFAMSISTVSQWVRRGRIVAAGTNEKGRTVYHLEHVEYLIRRGRDGSRWDR
ncbi:GIY-YIG nuclease family protein [Streptomyces hydrogenans]|uniref:GIY-YIG nuclease family protein n=1 Tax=Streptomyces hydrogenans TaxID=1873719 RepID=UPI0037FFDAF1